MSAASHGHTVAAWTGSAIAFAGFCVSGAAMIMESVPLFWAGMVVIVAAGVVGKAMAMAGMGKQPNPAVEALKAEAREIRKAETAAAGAVA
ncbi:ABC-type dipeptide/oligopeptide/nickel transport system permease component [Kitasatospora sp. MAP12-15]|uniref:HGxxPAAW family protein n=1 Tax=unclassified Kitasatospora TaxID=2633591 RepID=UPI002476B958|nr:HGxxPAAW family protein [Kitasatospora sp. MAP12-44]MDH6109950.1 ABC-type dipeptide/oligopeptide/nickel transport system permease component [Kitasatospora sp. MAP12-44]